MAYLPEISKRRSMEMLNLMENRLNVLKASGRRASAKVNEETPLERKSALRVQQLELRCLTVVDFGVHVSKQCFNGEVKFCVL